MGCCNERGVLRPLLSGSAASRGRNGDSSDRSKNSPRYNRNRVNRKRGARNTGNNNKNNISLSNRNGNGYDGMTNDQYDDDDDYDEFYEDGDVISCSCLCKNLVIMLRKIGLLVWKNLLLRRRHYIVTALEIILPTLCAMIMVCKLIKMLQVNAGMCDRYC